MFVRIDQYRFDDNVDPDFSSVVQNAHFDGANGSTTFTNSCSRGNTMTAVGAAALSTAQSKWGGSSLRISGTGTIKAYGADHTDYKLSNQPFAIEGWYRFDNVTAAQHLFAHFDGGAVVRLVNPGRLIYQVDNTDRITTATNVVSATTWHFLQLIRNIGDIFTLAVDGASVGTWSNSWNFGIATGELYVGNSAYDIPLQGYVDDFRVTKGVGRALAVPAAAFPNS